MLQEALSLSLVRLEDEIDIAKKFALPAKRQSLLPGVRRRQSKMAHPKSCNVSFRLLNNAMAFNTERAAKQVRKGMVARHGYTQEGLTRCLVSTSRANSSSVAA